MFYWRDIAAQKSNNLEYYNFKNNLQWGLEYRTFEYQIHWNTERFEVRISNGSVLEWSVIAIAMAPTFLKLNNWKLEQNGSHFVQNGTALEN